MDLYYTLLHFNSVAANLKTGWYLTTTWRPNYSWRSTQCLLVRANLIARNIVSIVSSTFGKWWFIRGKNRHVSTSVLLKSLLFSDDVCRTKRLEPGTTEVRVGVVVTHSNYKAKLKKIKNNFVSPRSHRRLYLNLPILFPQNNQW